MIFKLYLHFGNYFRKKIKNALQTNKQVLSIRYTTNAFNSKNIIKYVP